MDDLEKTRIQLKALIAIDADPKVIAAMRSAFLDFDPRHTAYLAGPVMKNAGNMNLPSWLVKTIYLDRMDQVFEEYKVGIVGEVAIPAEVLAVLYTINDKDGIWLKLYVWSFNQATAKFNLPLALPTVDKCEIDAAYNFLGTGIRSDIVKAGSSLLAAGVSQNAK